MKIGYKVRFKESYFTKRQGIVGYSGVIVKIRNNPAPIAPPDYAHSPCAHSGYSDDDIYREPHQKLLYEVRYMRGRCLVCCTIDCIEKL